MKTRKNSDGFLIFLALLVGLSVACASTRTDERHVFEEGSSLPVPHLILIQDYDVGSDAVKLDSSVGSKLSRKISGGDDAADRIKLGKSIAEAISEHLVTDIRKLGLAAERNTGELPKSGGPFLVIRGELLAVDEGNRLRRSTIGLGAGGTKVAAKTRVSLLEEGTETPVEVFTVKGKSGRKPGVATTMGLAAEADRYHDMKEDLDHLDFFGEDSSPSHSHAHLKQAAVASVATRAAVAVGSERSDTIGDSVQADAARGAQAIVKELTKLFRSQDWIDSAN